MTRPGLSFVPHARKVSPIRVNASAMIMCSGSRPKDPIQRPRATLTTPTALSAAITAVRSSTPRGRKASAIASTSCSIVCSGRPRERTQAVGGDGTGSDGRLRLGEAQFRTEAAAAGVARRLVGQQALPGASTPAVLFGASLVSDLGTESVRWEGAEALAGAQQVRALQRAPGHRTVHGPRPG